MKETGKKRQNIFSERGDQFTEERNISNDSAASDLDTEPEKENMSPVEKKTMLGVVANCAKLNIREEPNDNSDNVLCVVSAGDQLSIDVDTSTDDWLRVWLPSGISGFCMRKYVSIEQ